MTDYNDGLWHGWNGGECPVNRYSLVEVALLDCAPVEERADQWYWGGDQCRIVAFRVVKEYREPRELWHLLDNAGEVFDTFTDKDVAQYRANDCPGFTLVHYREVMDDAQHRMNVAAMLQSANAMSGPEDE